MFSMRLKWSHSARTNDVENVRDAAQEEEQQEEQGQEPRHNESHVPADI